MPRGGRRGRGFWQRLRDMSPTPPPPPPPHMRPPPPPHMRPPPPPHMRPAPPPHHRQPPERYKRGQRRGSPVPRRGWRGRKWIPGDGSPPRRCDGQPSSGSPRDIYMELDDCVSSVGMARNSPEICFICGDLLANHPEVPTIHLCECNDYAEVLDENFDYDDDDHISILSGESGKYSQARAPRPREPVPEIPASEYDVSATFKDTQQTLDSLVQQISEISRKFNSSVFVTEDGKGKEKDDETEENLTDKIVDDLQAGMQNQYETFLHQVKLQVQQKCQKLDEESSRIDKERENLESERMQLAARGRDLDLREEEVKEMKKHVEAERTKFVKKQDDEKAELRRQWQKLDDEKTRMEEIHKLRESRVKLDVGGNTFTTSVSTLTRDTNSMLAAMFSGRHEIKREADGTVFMDRDGTHFRYILNYLRDGSTEGSLPEDAQTLRELLQEAVYYQITDLVADIENKLGSGNW